MCVTCGGRSILWFEVYVTLDGFMSLYMISYPFLLIGDRRRGVLGSKIAGAGPGMHYRLNV